jgi:hypothetical protein
MALTAAVLAVSTLGFAPAPSGPRKPKVFVEKFTVAKDITTGYGLFTYETTTAGSRARVSGGRLHLLGPTEESDQRLVVTAQKALGQRKWPDSLEVVARLGGTGAGSGLWHVGLSVGSVKVLFHPDFPNGAFRAEAVDTHNRFFENEDMGFTPAAGVMHQLNLAVRRTGRVQRFEVELVDGHGRATYRKTFEVRSDQVGDFDRIGLERSGQPGGEALFESISVRSGKQDRP